MFYLRVRRKSAPEQQLDTIYGILVNIRFCSFSLRKSHGVEIWTDVINMCVCVCVCVCVRWYRLIQLFV